MVLIRRKNKKKKSISDWERSQLESCKEEIKVTGVEQKEQMLCTRRGDEKYTKSSAYCGYILLLTFVFAAREKSFLASNYKNSKFDANFGEKYSQKKMRSLRKVRKPSACSFLRKFTTMLLARVYKFSKPQTCVNTLHNMR